MALLKSLIYLLLIFYPLLEIAKITLIESVAISLNDLFIFLIAVWLLILALFKKASFKTKLIKPISYFILICFVSLTLNYSNYSFNQVAVSFLYLLRWAVYAFLYIAVVNLLKNNKKTITKLLFISGSIVLLFGFIQYLFYQDLGNLFYLNWDKHLYRLFGTFFDPNFAGAFFSLFFIFILGFLLRKNSNNRIILSILAFLSVLAIALTYSRSGLVMLVASTIVLLFLIKKIKYIFIFLVFLLLVIFSTPRLFQTEGTNLLRIASSLERIESTKNSAYIFEKNPAFGVGFNAYRYAQHKYGFISGEKWLVSHAGSGTDNSYLFILATTGVIGFVVYLCLLKNIFNLLKERLKSKNNQFAVIATASFLGLLINAVFINSLFYAPIMLWCWVIIGLTENS